MVTEPLVQLRLVHLEVVDTLIQALQFLQDEFVFQEVVSAPESR